MPTLSQYGLLQKMLRTIDHPIGHLLVIDNGGSCPPLESTAERTSIVHLPSNIGVAASWNLGIKLTPEAPFWMIGSDDILFRPGMLAQIPDLVQGALVTDWGQTAPFSCFAIHEDLIDAVGLFDEYFWPGCGEDRNYQRRVRKAGLPIRCLLRWYDAPIPGATRNSMPNAGAWLHDNFSQVRLEPRGFDLKRRRYMEETYLKGGPPIQATSE